MLLTLLSIVVAQARPGQPGGGAGGDACGGMAGLGCGCACLVLVLGMFVPMLIGAWKTFVKAGQPGIAAFIPVYQTMIFCKIAGKDENRWLFYFIPIVNIIFGIQDTIDFAKNFGKETGFAIGMILLPFIFWPILGFGSAKYVGAPTVGSVRRSARRYEDEDEGDVPPPRPRRRRTEEDY